MSFCFWLRGSSLLDDLATDNVTTNRKNIFCHIAPNSFVKTVTTGAWGAWFRIGRRYRVWASRRL
jgi:hypothetical protein